MDPNGPYTTNKQIWCTQTLNTSQIEENGKQNQLIIK